MAKKMWDYLKCVYNQENSVQKFQLELEIVLYNLGNLPIDQFYAGFLHLWNEYSGIIYSKVPNKALVALSKIQVENQRNQFLMKLLPEFETVKVSSLNCNPIIGYLLGRIITQRTVSCYLTGNDITVSSEVINVAYVGQGQEKSKSQEQCYSC